VIGHEVAGQIVEVGAGVTRVRTGDRIAWRGRALRHLPLVHERHGHQLPHQLRHRLPVPGGFQEYMLLNRTTLDYGP